MKKIIIITLMVIISGVFQSVYANNEQIPHDIKISNSLFSISMPYETKGTYTFKKRNKGIYIYHTMSKKAGFGGFAFGVQPFKEPSEYAMYPGARKIGELTDKKNKLYDIVLIQPTDVQYDYTKSVNPPKDFKVLYDLAQTIEINGVKKSKYFKGQGTKGKNLYNDILKKHVTAIQEKWDSNKLEQENMSYMYNVMAVSNSNVLDKVGYLYYDANGDGIEELLVGEIAEGDWKGVIYDMYTMVNRKPVHVMSGGSRDRYYICDETFICNEYSSSAMESGVSVYNLVENSKELFPQVSFKYDESENSKNPYFISYSDEKWENVSEKVFNDRKEVFDKYERFDFIPLSKLIKN